MPFEHPFVQFTDLHGDDATGLFFIRVHFQSPPQWASTAGRAIECRVLARAVCWHLQLGVLVNGHKGLVFR